jgi:hypothetical protein
MPFGKRKSGDDWVVYNKDTGDVKGTHSTESKANRQLAALYANVEDVKESEQWKEIQHYVYNHPVYGDLPKEELEETIAAAYETIGDKLEQLNEYVDMYMHAGGGFGPNSSGLAYGHAGSGHSGGSLYGYGGTGTGSLGGKSRQGTRVYGYDNVNGLTPGDGVAPIGGGNGDPAVVIVPPEESNYKPWEVELTNQGYREKDIERNETKQERDDLWLGPLGDVIRALEDSGVDIDDLNDMTQEEIEDTMIRVLKQEKRTEKLEEQADILKNAKTAKQLVLETFTFDEMEILDERKRQSRIQDAREILAKKHSQKQALEKKPTGRGFLIDQYGIEKLMKKYGYVYNYETKKWLKKDAEEKKKDDDEASKKKKKDDETPSTSKSNSEDDEAEDSNSIDSPEKTDGSEDSDSAQSSQQSDSISDPLREPNVVSTAKEHQARLILAMAHEMPTAVEFTLDEETKKELPIVPADQILMEMDKKQYTWNDDKLIWLNDAVTLPDIIFERGESKNSIIGRSILSAFGDKTFIQIQDDGYPVRSPEEVDSLMMEKGYSWNVDLGKWDFIGVSLNEAVDRRSSKTSSQKEFGFNPVDVRNLTGRYALKAEQIKELVLGDKKDISDKNDPLAFGSYPRIDRPLMSDKAVQNELTQRDYKLMKNGQMQYWSDRNNQAPSAVSELFDDELESFLARSILSVADPKNGAKYLTVDGDIENLQPKQDDFSPSVTREDIEDRMEQAGFLWDKKRGWFQRTSFGDDEEDMDVEPDKVSAYKDEDETIRRYDRADWDLMSFSDKQKYKEALGNKMARQTLGIEKKDWPTGDDPVSARKRQNARNRMGIHYKFDKNTKQYVKRDKPVSMKGDWVDLKAATKNTLSRAMRGGALAGGFLGKAFNMLSKLNF